MATLILVSKVVRKSSNLLYESLVSNKNPLPLDVGSSQRIKLFQKEEKFFISVYEVDGKLFAMNWEMEDGEPIFYQQPFLCKIENGRVFRY